AIPAVENRTGEYIMKQSKLYALFLVFVSILITGNLSKAFAYSLDNANHVLTISPGSSPSATTSDLRNAFTYLQNRSDKSTRWTMRFNPGKYYLTSQVVTDKLQNIDFVSNASNPAIFLKASGWSTSAGEFLLYNKFSKNISFRGFQF